MLGYFKYTNFLIEIANNLFGQGFLNFQNIFLPVGISFFLFQSLSYTIDICRGQLKPLNNWADYLFYLSFFPQLVAGPIVRAKDFIPQIRQNPLRVTREMFGMGVFLILIGLFKKAVISDYISLNFVDRIFDEPLLYSGFECLMGIYGYALQIYCDFSGYSDMAIGLALLLGFRFPKNFDAPYKSATITEIPPEKSLPKNLSRKISPEKSLPKNLSRKIHPEKSIPKNTPKNSSEKTFVRVICFSRTLFISLCRRAAMRPPNILRTF